MPRFYRARFYSDIKRNDETEPSEVHSLAYPSQLEAEKAAGCRTGAHSRTMTIWG